MNKIECLRYAFSLFKQEIEKDNIALTFYYADEKTFEKWEELKNSVENAEKFFIELYENYLVTK